MTPPRGKPLHPAHKRDAPDDIHLVLQFPDCSGMTFDELALEGTTLVGLASERLVERMVEEVEKYWRARHPHTEDPDDPED